MDVENGLAGMISNVKKIRKILKSYGKEDEPFALVNCVGLGARKFGGKEEAEKIYPIRGQTVPVKGEAHLARAYTALLPQ